MDRHRALRAELEALRNEFLVAHHQGTDALSRNDLEGFDAAIRREREIIDAQRVLMDAFLSRAHLRTSENR